MADSVRFQVNHATGWDGFLRAGVELRHVPLGSEWAAVPAPVVQVSTSDFARVVASCRTVGAAPTTSVPAATWNASKQTTTVNVDAPAFPTKFSGTLS